MLKKPLVIYYSYTYEHMDSKSQMLFDFKPESLMADIKKSRVREEKKLNTQEKFGTNGYHFCTALHEMVDHSYMLKAPFDAEIFFDESGTIVRETGKNNFFFANREGSFENCHSVDFKFSLILFSEDKVNMTLTPPYFHKTIQPEYGYLASGRFDISSWFRPIPVIYNLWSGVNSLKINQGEPMGYIHFDTNRRIVFKQFEMNKNIFDIISTVGNFKFLSSFEPLEKLYNRFRMSGLRDILIKEIQKSVI